MPIKEICSRTGWIDQLSGTLWAIMALGYGAHHGLLACNPQSG